MFEVTSRTTPTARWGIVESVLPFAGAVTAFIAMMALGNLC